MAKHYYGSLSPKQLRINELARHINAWQARGELWDTDNEEVTKALEEYDELNHQIRGALDFSNEDWSTNEEDQDSTPEVRTTDERDNAEEPRDTGPKRTS